jgi:hypothetical protein
LVLHAIFWATGTCFIIITSLEILLKTFSAKFVGGRTKSSCFGQNSVLVPEPKFRKKLKYRDLSIFFGN